MHNPAREVLTQEQRADKYYELLQENTVLKTKQTELDTDIKKMAARLQKIKSIISKERKIAGGVLGKEFDQELDDLIDENTTLKTENKKLKSALKGAKSELKKSPYKKSLTRPKTGGSMIKKETDIDEHQLIKKLKDTIKDNIKTITSMQEEIILLRNSKPETEHSKDFIKNLQDRDTDIYKMRCTLDETLANYEGLNAVLQKCKSKNKELLDDLRSKKEENINLHARLAALEGTKGAVDDLKEQLHEVEQERNNLEERLKDLTAEPFFKREQGVSAQNRIEKLEMILKDKDDTIKKFKENILNHVQKEAEIEASLNSEKDSKKKLQEKYDEIKERYEGSNEMTIDTVQKQLMKIDPVAFRKTMEELNYQGNEPYWSIIDFVNKDDEEASNDVDHKDPKSLLREIERLKNGKREIAAELEKWQQMLKLQSNLEEEKLGMIREEAEQLKIQCKAYNTKIEDLALQLDLKQKENAELRKIIEGKGGKYPGQGISFDKTMESMSDFSDITEETNINAQENVLDVAIDSGEFYPNSLVQMLGKNKVKEDTFDTFIAISFYDHETQATDVSSGFGPNYSTQFAFKNRFDDFYIEYLDTHVLRLELYLSKGNKPQLIGLGSILLKELLESENVNPNKKRVINSMVDVMSANNTDVSIGRLKYKLRLRNAFNQAIKFYKERKAAELYRAEKAHVKAKNKILSFEIIECKDLNLKKVDSDKLKPFCYYQFYNFDEHHTIASSGKNPRYDDIQNYEVSFTPDFVEFLDKEYLEITVLDDSTPLLSDDEDKSKDGDRDVVGVAKVPLKLLALSKEIAGPVAIINHKGKHCGVLYIRINVSDPIRKYAATQGGAGLAVTTLWEKDTIESIWESLAKSTKIRDVDSVFELFSKHKEKISHKAFKKAVMPLKWGLSEREVDLFINSSALFNSGSKDKIDKKEFLGIFSQPLFDAFEKYDRIAKQNEKEEEKVHKPTETETDLDRDTNQKQSTMRSEATREKITKKDIIKNIDDIKDKLEKYLKRQNLTLKGFWDEICKKKEIPPNRFANKLIKIEDLNYTKFEAHVLFKYVDEGDLGKIRYKDFSLACKDVYINVLMKRFREHCQTNNLTYMELFDKYDDNKRHAIQSAEANQMFYDLQSDLERYELDYLFRHFDPAKSQEITRTGFDKFMDKRSERVG